MTTQQNREAIYKTNDRANHRKAPVRRETNEERLSRMYGNGIIHTGNYDGMHIGPPTNFIKDICSR